MRFLYNKTLYKAIKNFNHSFMKQIFELRKTNRKFVINTFSNLNIFNYNQVAFGKKNLRLFGLKILKSLAYHIKYSRSLESFKTIIKNCKRNDCKYLIWKHISKFYSRFYSNVYSLNVCVIVFN